MVFSRLKKRLGRRLRRGFRLCGYDIRWIIAKLKIKEANHPLIKRDIEFLVERFPDVQRFYDESVLEDLEASEAFFHFLQDYIPVIHPPALETHIRNLLVDKRESSANSEREKKINRLIYISWLRSGHAEIARSLLKDQPFVAENSELAEEIGSTLCDYEKWYGANAPYFENQEVWDKNTRGSSLVYWFNQNQHSLKNQTILHIAPEAELRKWFELSMDRLNVQYKTFDGVRDDTDIQSDLRDIPIGDESVDLIICHRVLEHLLDDRAAILEMFRILRNGGILHVSVPQSMQNERTNEWFIQDSSLHGHVRQYGRDFEQKLTGAGFEVEVNRLLLDLTLDEHKRHATQPLRLYICSK